METILGKIFKEENILIINREDYGEFIKDERKFEFVLSLEEKKRVRQILFTLEKYLEISKKTGGDIKSFSIKGNRIEIDASKYIIHMLVLHIGDVCQYTINKKTNHKGNYSRRFHYESIVDTLNKFIS